MKGIVLAGGSGTRLYKMAAMNTALRLLFNFSFILFVLILLFCPVSDCVSSVRYCSLRPMCRPRK